MPVADFVKDIEAKKIKAIKERLKKEKASQKYVPNAKNPAVFHTLLHVAVKTEDPAIVEALLAAGADVTAVDNESSTALHWAAKTDAAPTIAEMLVKKKAKVDAINAAKQTPLHVAAAAGALAVMDVLLKAGSPADVAPPGGVTPLHTVVSACCETGLKPSTLLAAVDKLVAAGAKLAAKDPGGLTPLMRLVRSDRVAEAMQLMERPQCGLDELDPSGCSVLMAAVASDTAPHMDLIRDLVAKGASVDLQYPKSLDTPLHVAARKALPQLIAVLLPAAKKPYTRNAANLTPAEVALAAAVSAASSAAAAAAGGSGGAGGESKAPEAGVAVAVVEALVGGGGDPGDAGMRLMKAAVEGKVDSVAALLVPLVKPSVLTSLDLDFKKFVAAGLGKAAVAYLKHFEPAQAGDAVLDAEGNTHLHLLAESGASYQVVVALVSQGMNPNAINKEGDTPLHVAARAGHLEVCRALVDGGADVLRRNNKNRTPRTQLKLPDCTKDYLAEAEEAFKAAKELKKSTLWDDKMKATQTESAFGLRVM